MIHIEIFLYNLLKAQTIFLEFQQGHFFVAEVDVRLQKGRIQIGTLLRQPVPNLFLNSWKEILWSSIFLSEREREVGLALGEIGERLCCTCFVVLLAVRKIMVFALFCK